MSHILGSLAIGYVVLLLYSLAFFVPSLALACRRIRDIGKSPWMILLGLIPIVGSIIIFVFYLMPSVYEHPREHRRMTPIDWVILAVCLLLPVGSGVAMASASGSHSYDDDNDYEYEYRSDSYSDEDGGNDFFSEVSEEVVEEEATPAAEAAVSDDSPLSYCVSSYSRSMPDYHLGSDFSIYNDPLGMGEGAFRGSGFIDKNWVRVEFFVTRDGRIYGRYLNENGTKLDMNGFVNPDGSLLINLGHRDNSTLSEWRLEPDPYAGSSYRGTWGRSDKPSRLAVEQVAMK